MYKPVGICYNGKFVAVRQDVNPYKTLSYLERDMYYSSWARNVNYYLDSTQTDLIIGIVENKCTFSVFEFETKAYTGHGLRRRNTTNIFKDKSMAIMSAIIRSTG